MEGFTMNDKGRAEAYLAAVRGVPRPCPLMDIHAHPFELFFSSPDYTCVEPVPGLYATDGIPYRVPTVSDAASLDDELRRKAAALFTRPALARQTLARLYRHTGPHVFEAQMHLSGIDGVLLLPVAHSLAHMERQMAWMKAMFGGHGDRFLFGWCVPNDVPEKDIRESLDEAVRCHGIRAVKLHPNLCRIEPRTPSGRNRIEVILDACGRLGLPLVVHGGKSPLAGESALPDCAVAEGLDCINWSLSGSAVIIAHAGAYGSTPVEIEDRVLPRLLGMLERHSNLFADVSGLDTASLFQILSRVSPERLLFGSDMLYESQWATVVRLLHALHRMSSHPEEIFLRIAGENIWKHVLGEPVPQPKRVIAPAGQIATEHAVQGA
jgi:predicted TIM-barrel fold metal-dependent hydrolase